MTPAETLRAAAEAIDGYLDKLPVLPWQSCAGAPDEDACGNGLHIIDGIGEQIAALDVREDGEGTARWVILSPTLLRMVGEFLEDLAGDAQEMPADMRAVAIAEVVLAALSPTE